MNRINAAIVVIATAVLLAVGSAQTGKPTATAGSIGRYQLLAGDYEVDSPTGLSITVKGIFRIDTATGATSFYSRVLPGNGNPLRNEWYPINEFLK